MSMMWWIIPYCRASIGPSGIVLATPMLGGGLGLFLCAVLELSAKFYIPPNKRHDGCPESRGAGEAEGEEGTTEFTRLVLI